MYSAAHKLVGAARYAGAMRIGLITDKMQKWVPRDSTTPNFDRYRKLHTILTRETKTAFEEFDKYKKANPGAVGREPPA